MKTSVLYAKMAAMYSFAITVHVYTMTCVSNSSSIKRKSSIAQWSPLFDNVSFAKILFKPQIVTLNAQFVSNPLILLVTNTLYILPRVIETKKK